ncbi:MULTISPECIES: hypothetical protein [Paenibacillus]|uniref:hypothetical protein n=1 Tax=Paenibacillus TaxID=44249 RepID=UPI0022B93783|nr:hypothetical protein [Paenibacillus caseinilyticus]MCZ8522507.1 hypothetical protein [Paenibacillus caseinilyticus]
MNNQPPFRDLAIAQGFTAVLLFLLVPAANLFGPGYHKLAGTLHGLAASLTMLMATYTWHAYYGYARGRGAGRGKLALRLWMTNGLSLLTIVTANWLYIGYQSPEGASEWFKLHLPAAHWVIMEYKEFVSLLTLPCGLAASVLLHRLGGRREAGEGIRFVIGMLLTMLWVCMLIGFASGLILAKWKLV